MDLKMTPAEHVKTFAPLDLRFLDLGQLRGFMEDKGFDLQIVKRLGERELFSHLFGQLVLRNSTRDDRTLNQFGEAIDLVDPSRESDPYIGSYRQNSKIDAGLANSGIAAGKRRFGEGSATLFEADVTIPQTIQSTPIAIIGHGAAGVMMEYALRRLGFTAVTVYERAKPLGIWGHENVHALSRNNPVNLEFYGNVLQAAPGGGIEVKKFLENLFSQSPKKQTVVKVETGNLSHKIVFSNGKSKRYPIVINAIGLGKPRPVSDESRMLSKTGERHSGIRWQHQLHAERMAGQRIILIGLGNSTAEMLRQIHTIQDAGVDVDYRLLTHYPEDSIRNPSSYVPCGDKMFRVFRDTSKPNLVDFQGDLPHSRYDYFRAFHAGRIIPEVRGWEVENPGVMTIYADKKTPIGVLPYDKVMSLIGYRQPEETMRALGCAYDAINKCGIFDYDGEFVSKPGRKKPSDRLHKGYFGFGSVLESPFNPNAIVIPGMLHRIGDVLFGIIMRSLEHRKKAFLQGR